MIPPPHVPMERRAVNLKWWAVVVAIALNLLTLMTTLSALVWGAATMSSSVDQLKTAVLTVSASADQLRGDISKTREDVSAIKAVLNLLQTNRPR